MNSSHSFLERGQAYLEYILLIALVAINVIAALALLSPRFPAISQKLGFGDSSTPAPVSATDGDENSSPIADTANDFMKRMRTYHDQNGRWARGREDYRYRDLGLNPDDWEEPMNGIYWDPKGDRVGLANKKEDNLQVYVRDQNGKRLHLYDGWNIWCMAESGVCYYHTVAPGNEVDVNTIQVVQQKKSGDD